MSQTHTELVTIVEDLSASGQRAVDASGCVIRGVKLIGFESVNGRSYPPAVLRASTAHYEGAKVNVNHPTGGDPTKPRALEDRIGVIRNARIVEGAHGGIYGDFHYNPEHRLAKQISWDAQHAPDSLGFSHNALLRMGPVRGDKRVVEEIVKVRSVDLVADPATTRSLFESEIPRMEPTLPVAAPAVVAPAEKSDPKDQVKAAFRAMVIAAFDDDKLDIKATLTKIRQIMQAQEKLLAGDLVAGGDGQPGAETEQVQLRQQVALLSQQVEQFQAKERQQALHAAIEQELAAAGLNRADKRHVSEPFAKLLLATESKDERAALIADRASLVTGKHVPVSATEHRGGERPKSGPVQALEQIDAQEFSRRLRMPAMVRR